ncbi:MAG: DUF2075 domain-containing protein [Lachnospiraceae bacterium]|jgi:DUF2075 family protein|nr:DUF2075 domain-containing protein [Lachnospiraceae bacterium]MCI1397674.1 DUF2075 domain-containing protein [Lachnospiraceae bacterium]MCI1423626.1 DUF2075 domain-containing protein [Lachnospiraceae bacterium]MCI1452431.1 DUF2075 domain-containing protein [Lachnospiraceae bacterium]
MIIYNGTKAQFEQDVDADVLEEKLDAAVREKLHRRTGPSELASWKNSSQFMYRVLAKSSLPADAGVALEYNIPQTAKRIDYLITGYGPDEKENVVIIELKQWSALSAIPGRDCTVCTFLGGSLVATVHPSYQAQSYADFIYDYNVAVRENRIGLHPCAYLHNYERADHDDPLDSPQYRAYTDKAPAFTMHQAPALRAYIERFIRIGDRKKVLYDIENGQILPSKSLQDELAAMLRGKKEFTLIDDQMVAFEEILEAARKCQQDGKKRTLIVEGGPGTGKTVIAMNLLSALTGEGQYVIYASKNAAPRNVYLEKLTAGGFRKTSVQNMFKGSGSFVDTQENAVGTILCDEAHRLNEKSGMYHNQGTNQIWEIIRAAKCSVFFLDESQRVTVLDIGSREEIEKWAKKEGSEVSHLSLSSQFRCNGSDGYLAFLDDVLEIRETANPTLSGIDYDFRVVDDPNTLLELIFQKNDEGGRNRSRIIAGYCWEWPAKEKANPDYPDIVIQKNNRGEDIDFGMSWNLSSSSTYAIDPDSVHQAGCIHTTQGLEFDYVGVIIGDDLRFENGHVITDVSKRARSDQSVKGLKKMAKTDPEKAKKLGDAIVRNTYRTILSRGMKGCFVYCTDAALAEHLKERLG